MLLHEDDISAEEEIQSEGSRISRKNEHSKRQKGFGCQKSKGKKAVVCLGHSNVTFSSIWIALISVGRCRSKCRGMAMRQFVSLKNYRQFHTVYDQGRSFANRYLVLYICENGTEQNRVGISVSKKVGTSVVRHRITRLIRESYRLNQKRFSQGWDLVVIARSGAKGRSYWEIESALLHLGKIHGILTEGNS